MVNNLRINPPPPPPQDTDPGEEFKSLYIGRYPVKRNTKERDGSFKRFIRDIVAFFLKLVPVWVIKVQWKNFRNGKAITMAETYVLPWKAQKDVRRMALEMKCDKIWIERVR